MTAELDRRIANIVRIGTVSALQESPPRVQIDLGDLTTDWLPWSAGRSGENRSWDAYEVGEQVLLFAPSGDLANAVVMGTVPQDAYPAPANSKDHTRYQWKDGAFHDYDRAGHHYVLDIPSAGDITLHIGASTLTLKNDQITAAIGGTTLKLEDGKATLTTNEFDVVAALSKFSGNVQIAGGATVGAGLAVTGATTMTGSVTSSGAMTAASVATASGISLSGHHHTAQGSSAPTTPAQA